MQWGTQTVCRAMATYVQLSTTAKMPLVGLGTWKVRDSEKSSARAAWHKTPFLPVQLWKTVLVLGALLCLPVRLNLYWRGATDKRLKTGFKP